MSIDYADFIQRCLNLQSERGWSQGVKNQSTDLVIVEDTGECFVAPLRYVAKVLETESCDRGSVNSGDKYRELKRCLLNEGYVEVTRLGDANTTEFQKYEAYYHSLPTRDFSNFHTRVSKTLVFLSKPQAEEAYLPAMIDVENALNAAEAEAATFQRRIELARTIAPEKRRQLLAEADPVPERIFRVVAGFRRNQYVIAERLERANGTCDGCGADAPFLRARDQTPFLEVHHVIPLAEGGSDTVENTKALCPNCHRKEHFA